LKGKVMGERYVVTGVQLGIIKALADIEPNKIKEQIEIILDEQYAGQSNIEVSQFAKEVRQHCSD